MHRLLVIPIALALLLPVVAAAATRPAPGSLSIEDGRGVVAIKGQGGVLGKLDGVLQIVDLTPRDRWSAIVNGEVVQGPRVRVRGEEISFRLLGGRFKLVLKGENISISARGRGIAQLRAETDSFGFAGLYSTELDADCVDFPEACELLPEAPLRVAYGFPAGDAGTREDSRGAKENSDKRSRQQ